MKRRDTLILVGLVPVLLVGCVSTPAPVHWYELKSAPPEAPSAARAGDGAVWELSGRMRLPGPLERDTLVVSSGSAGVLPLEGHRWVEPLRDSIPVRLAADLALLRGEGLVWLSPAPPGVSVARRLRVEIDTLVADEARQALRLRAHWWFANAIPTALPTMEMADIRIELPDRSVDALAAAHRLAIWRLAQRIAAVP